MEKQKIDQKVYQRLAIKGFDWIDQKEWSNASQLSKASNFQNFKILDEKKKWKKKYNKTFEGFGERIKKRILANSAIKEINIADQKQELFNKQMEELRARNQLKKINKMKKVEQICSKEKNYKEASIVNYFEPEIEWIIERLKPYQPGALN